MRLKDLCEILFLLDWLESHRLRDGSVLGGWWSGLAADMSNSSNRRPFFEWVIPILSFISGVGFTVFFMRGIQHPSEVSDPIPQKPPNIPETVELDQPNHPAPGEPSALSQSLVVAPLDGGLESEPIPTEWESPLFAALELSDMGQRNQALIQLATVTARHVPRVQAECLAHLTFGLEEKNYPAFLALARNRELPLECRVNFVRKTLEIRRPEFSGWLAQNLANDPQSEVAALARNYLNELRSRPPESPSAEKGGL